MVPRSPDSHSASTYIVVLQLLLVNKIFSTPDNAMSDDIRHCKSNYIAVQLVQTLSVDGPMQKECLATGTFTTM